MEHDSAPAKYGDNFARCKMNVKWDRKPETKEARMVVDYLAGVPGLVEEILALSAKYGLLTASFTPKPLGKNFFTFEIRYDHPSSANHLVVWRGVRVGDAVPLLYGVLA